MINHEIRDFQNPDGFWEHHGQFTVELTPGTDKSKVPDNVYIVDNTICVDEGSVVQTDKGFRLSSHGQPFFWVYPFIRVIRNGVGNLLWVNDDYR